ncbi:hypothetical protein ACJROX_08205 [Pseudalkalibacillus sp. A8]|uniref:hypothetical protein n=1 Tax=Pseudalkalibacillus sp. A8 TaxID=3382641 RepID=UPI0038B5E21A
MKTYLDIAVLNNIAWCEIICKTHQIEYSSSRHVWGILSKAPPFYPDIITSSKAATTKEVVDFMGDKNILSIKDSFADLKLQPYGFKQLFQAEWIYHPPISMPKLLDSPWRVIATEDELKKWTSVHGSEQVIKKNLLGRNDVKIFIHEHKDGISGFIANLGADVVGISNVFSNGYIEKDLWSDIVHVVSTVFPDLSMVGYEHDDDLKSALSCGWVSLGPLYVWVKS